MKKFRKRMVCGLLGLSMAISVFGGLPGIVSAEDITYQTQNETESNALLGVEIIGIPKVEPAFDPSITSYTATTYRNTSEVTLKPVAINKEAVVTVNGEDLTNGYKDVPVNLGENQITVEVTYAGETKVYTIVITKVDTDYRGRKALTPEDGISYTATSSMEGHGIENVYDGDKSTYWKAEDLTNQEVVIDLGQQRVVSKIDYAPPTTLETNYLKIGRMDKTEILVSKDGISYKKVAQSNSSPSNWMFDNRTTAPAKGYFNQLHFAQTEARYIKLKSLGTYQDGEPVAGEIIVFEDLGGIVPPEEDQTPLEPLKPQNPDISKSSDFVIQRGLQLPAWTATEGTSRGYMNKEEFEALGITGVITYDPGLVNEDFISHNPKAQWGISKGPYGSTPEVPSPENYLPPKLEEYINNATTFCCGDEQGYSEHMIDIMRQVFDITRDKYPHVLNHSNQYINQWSQEQLRKFMWIAQPDMFTYDYYPWTMGNVKDYDSASVVASQANYQRQIALEGYDQTGEKPLVFGQYITAYNEGRKTVETTESQRKSHLNISLAMGMKWLGLFRIEYYPETFELFDADGAPTRHFYAWADAFEKAKNVGDHLVRLNSDEVVLKPGQHRSNGQVVSNNIPSGYKLGGFKPNDEYHIYDVAAENLGVQNNELAGDVVIGYLKPLPGLNEEQLSLFTSKSPKYMMVVNGLMQGNQLDPKDQHGMSYETRQKITLTFKDPVDNNALRKVNNLTGQVEKVELIPVAGQEGMYTVELGLGGGEFELLFWEEDRDYIPETSEDNLLVVNNSQVGTGMNQFDFSSEWIYGNPPENYMGDEHYSGVIGSTMTFKFTGTQFELYGIKGYNQGRMAIYMDGEQVDIVDAYNPERIFQQLLYKSPTLEEGEHIFKLEILPETSSPTKETVISVDKIVVENDGKLVVSKQQGEAVQGENSTITYEVTTENVPDGSQVNVRFKGVQTTPQAIQISTTDISNNQATITMNISEDIKVGNYYFEVNVSGMTSKIATLTVAKEKGIPQIILSAPENVEGGKTAEIAVSLNNATKRVYAQDLVFTYDPDLFEQPIIKEINGTMVVEEANEIGQIRVLLAKENGFEVGEEIINILLTAKPVEEKTQSNIGISNVSLGVVDNNISTAVEGQGTDRFITILPNSTNPPEVDKTELIKSIKEAEKLSAEAVVGNEVGQYPELAKQALDAAIMIAKDVEANSQDQVAINQATLALKEAIKTFRDSQIKLQVEDVTGDNRVDIADLALVAYYYMATPESDNWHEAVKADINSDEIIDIIDLGWIANKILE